MTHGSVQIIYLNGPSSSGKTTLAKALQHAFNEPFLHIGIDKIIGWMPEKVNDWTGGEAPLGYSWKKSQDEDGNPIQELQAGPYAQRIGKTFREVVLALAKMGHQIIIDDVSFGKNQVDEWRESLKHFQVLWVGVNAPLSVLEQREKERGNRIVGSARGQFHKVHVDTFYDLEIDTHQASLTENIEKIKSFALRPFKAQKPNEKMGFLEEGCLKSHIKTESGYIDDILMALHIKGPLPDRKISRTGVYGIAKENGKVLLVIQKSGPYAGLFDLPGGGIEFGEDPSQALHREFIEETGMNFRSMNHIDNLSVVTRVPASNGKLGYAFHQIGLIYSVEGLQPSEKTGILKYEWKEAASLKRDNTSPLAWNALKETFLIPEEDNGT